MANVLKELEEQLSKRVGGSDIAKGIIEGIQAQKGINRAGVQKQVKNLIKDIDTDDIVKKAKFTDSFAEEAGGQMVIKGLGGSKGSSTVSEAVEQASKNSNEIPGQISMFADSTGQMHTPETKIRQIKEARKSTMMDNLSEGSDGQMYMNFGYKDRPEPKPGRKYTFDEAMSMSDAEFDALSDADVSKYADVIYEHDMKKINAKKQIEGQQSFLVDKNGNLNTEYGVQQLRQAEVDKANRSWIRKRLDGAGEAWSNLKSNVSDIITGNGDETRRIAGRNTRESARQAANQAYVETGRGSAQSKKGFYKNYKPNTPSNMGPSSNASDYTNILGSSSASDVAEENATKLSELWDGLPDWAKYTGTAVAGGIAGAVLFGGDDDN